MIIKTVQGERKEYIKKQLSVLIQLAKIDLNYDQPEKAFISEFGRTYNLSRNEIEEIERNPVPLENIDSFTPEEKFKLLYSVVRLAKVDRKILPNEIIYCQEIAAKLGFKRKVISALLPYVNDQPLEFVNYNAIWRKVAPFL